MASWGEKVRESVVNKGHNGSSGKLIYAEGISMWRISVLDVDDKMRHMNIYCFSVIMQEFSSLPLPSSSKGDFLACSEEVGDGIGNMMASSALMMKAEAIRKNLKVCSGSGYGIIYDVLMWTQTVQQVTFLYTPRNCNKMAHQVAAYAFRNGG
ncbi:unnamed protein product [Prunus armeniaca]